MKKYALGVLTAMAAAGAALAADSVYYRTRPTWQETLTAAREAWITQPVTGDSARDIQTALFLALKQSFPVETDWLCQVPDRYELDDHSLPIRLVRFLDPERDSSLEQQWIDDVLDSFPGADAGYAHEREALTAEGVPAGDRRWLDLLVSICSDRRAQRLAALAAEYPVITFVKRHPVRPSFFAYTEGQSDAQQERHFERGATLCLLNIRAADCTVEDLLDDPDGVIRDPDVSYDGKRLLFAWKKSDRQDDYHLYEMDVATRTTRQLTFGQGVADYEGCYLPNGDIVFSSTRCVQTVDCWWTEVSNMYTCDPDGNYLRRLGFDQVHTVHPSVLNNGKIVYTRWDYNDRGQVFPQALFQMNPDGTGQTEYYGNNSWYPTTLNHARAIPGSDKLVAVIHGHHTWQAGELALIDCGQGMQEAEGVQLIAPVRKAKAVRVDALGQERELFRHPYPINEREFLVAMTPDRHARVNETSRFGLYWIDVDGDRELLVYDPDVSCNSPVPIRSRRRPHVKPSQVDYTQDSGVYYVQDVYIGPGLEGIPRGTVKKLRVVALEFRAAGIGNTGSNGEAGGALISTPIAIGNGAWDVKKVLGTTPVHEDGSAMFRVPAYQPVYFQALDHQGQVVQTMRSWSTLMPGEVFGCVGCHENKQTAPPVHYATMASSAGPQELTPFYGPPRGFSFTREIQPILDRQCVGCHQPDGEHAESQPDHQAFSLRGDPVIDAGAGRKWSRSYLVLTGAGLSPESSIQRAAGQADRPILNWISSQSRPSMLPPYHRGSATSGIITLLREGHYDVHLSTEEMEKLCAWIDLGVPFCGDYLEANAWNDQQKDFYLKYQLKREQLASEIRQNTQALLRANGNRPPVPHLSP